MRRITSCIVVLLMMTASVLFAGSSPQASAQGPFDLFPSVADQNVANAGAGVKLGATNTTNLGQQLNNLLKR